MSPDMQRFMFAAGIAGAALGVSSQIPLLGCACCLFAIGAGYLASYLYLKDQPGSSEPRYGEGALLGITTGFVGAAVATLISIPVQLLMGSLGGFDQAFEALEEAELPPEVVDLISRFGGAGFSLVATLFSFFLYILLFVTFALVGAVIGVAVMHKKPA